jgi:glycosyltransferase involved in cell wall biosynthesis
MIRWADVVHLTAVYSASTIPTLALCRILNKPVVWSPRGSLQRWEDSSRPRLKRLWEFICNSLCDKERVTMHFTSDKELLESASRIERAAVVVIPNGVDRVERPKHYSHEKPESLRLLYLGRLDQIKGIENLITALQGVDGSVTLSLCGEGSNGYAGTLKALTEKLGLVERVKFRGRVADEEKEICFDDSDVLVMPSFNESFGLSAAEALSHGLPVIASKGTPWSEVEKVGCGLWVENDPQSLADAIERIRQMPLAEMGRRGREWMSREFSWDVIAGKMFKVYEGLVKQPHDG